MRPKTQEDCKAFALTLAMKMKKGIPGPGTYDTGTTITRNGYNFNSKYKNSGAPLIRGGTKFANQILGTAQLLTSKAQAKLGPGPGQYEPKTSLSSVGQYWIAQYKGSKAPCFGKA